MPFYLRNLESCSVADLVALVEDLLQRVAALEAENASLKQHVRASMRAAAPLSNGKPNPFPKKPGRWAGEGWLVRRAMLVPGPEDGVEEIHVPPDSPDRPRWVDSLEVVEQSASVEDTLPHPVRCIRLFSVEPGRCHVCRWTGRGRHEGLAAGQHGATPHRTGPKVMARVLTLYYHYGRPLSTVLDVIAAATGIRLTQNALTQAVVGLAAERGVVNNNYQELRAAGPGSALVNTNDTGWRVAGARAFLTGFFTPILAVCRIGQGLDHQPDYRRLRDAGHERLLDEIGRQHEQGRALLFLEHPEIESTNNRGERGLRRAVIARAVSHCSGNEQGPRTDEAMKCVTATLAVRGHSVARALGDLIQLVQHLYISEHQHLKRARQ